MSQKSLSCFFHINDVTACIYSCRLFWFWSPLSALKTAQPLSAELLEILIEFWLRNKKQYFLKKIESWKKRWGGSGCVTFCFPLSCFGRRSLVRSAFAAMGRTEISLPSRLASPRFPSSSCFPSVFLLLLLFFASPYPSVISPRSPVAVSVVSRSQLERTSGRDEAAQVPGASMKSLQRRDD